MSSETKKKTNWRSQKEAYQEALDYMQGRQKGTITSLRTPWQKLDDAAADGIEWHSTIVIAGRPASGKTLIKDQIVREAHERNQNVAFRVLEFQFEMVGRVSAMRSFSSHISKPYKYLCSAEGAITKEHLVQCFNYAKKMTSHPIDVVDEPCTVNEFCQIVAEYMESHATIVKDDAGNVTKTYTKTMVTLDHSLLVKKAAFEKDKLETLFNFGEALTRLKRRYPIIFIILSQLNRDIDRPERNEDGKYGNFVLESDLYGADAMLQHADMVIGINRPGKQKIHYYGVERYIIEDETVMVWHFIKARNGDTRMSFMRTEFDKMGIVEMAAPPTQERHIKTRS